ncbi:cellulose biosynthesis cyclic di-GMP-binding regulatory protein BcsB [Kerstersia sp.]|uniref:cellulose biosynthesis cyclic di-GMP-binding regulatory protein BcsB n=1 Tax=Kerstersia sp. TaxID=1930783 RepID=UPI003F92E694
MKSKPTQPTFAPGLQPWSVLAYSLLLGLAAPAMAAPAADEPAAAAAPVDTTINRDLTFKELGARYPLNLRGVDASNSLPFNIRADEIVKGAQVNLNYAYSPSMLSDLSHINVLINDEVAATIQLPKDTAGQNLQKTIELPPQLITSFNQLRMQLIGHYTLECEDPLHSSLWANISNNSQLELAIDRINLPNELSLFPLPFFDFRDTRELNLPFVFASQIDDPVLEGAGALSSLFGNLAGYRGATFPASRNQIPSSGNAIVFSDNASAFPELYGKTLSGPTLSVISNPNDPAGKLLLVLGRDSKEIKQAAIALAAGNQTLSGSYATITQFDDIKPRQPYDAPKWLRTDRPASFGELIEPQKLNVSGYSPDLIRVDLRLPPDLFGWKEKDVPINLKYRYTPQPTSVNSSLLFSVDDLFMKSVPLYSLAELQRATQEGQAAVEVLPDESLPREILMEVPLETLLDRSQLQFRYMYDYIKQGECRDIIIDNVRGHINPESTIDLTAYPHYKAMPDLLSFGESGWPFTRLADLSETAVVLNKNPKLQEISTYLDLMGLMGEATGYPALYVTVTSPEKVGAQADKDLLVISSGSAQPLLTEWSAELPAAYTAENGKRFGTSDLLYRVLGWNDPDPRNTVDPQRNEIAYTSDGVNAIVAGFESPLAKQRSVVLVASNAEDGLSHAAAAIRKAEGYDTPLHGSLSIVRGNKVDALVGDQTYYTGSLGFFKRIQWMLAPYLTQYPWLLTLVTILIVLLLASILISLIRWLARRRQDQHNTHQ